MLSSLDVSKYDSVDLSGHFCKHHLGPFAFGVKYIAVLLLSCVDVLITVDNDICSWLPLSTQTVFRMIRVREQNDKLKETTTQISSL